MMAALETLFSAEGKERYRQAAQIRTSCRSYSGAPDSASFAALSYAIGRYAMSGARLVLTPVDESLFTGTILGMGRIAGCRMAAVVIADRREAMSRVNAGIIGEAFVLEATSQGLGTCWVAGTYKRKLLTLPLGETEEILGVIAVGIPSTPLKAPENRRRKPVERLIHGSKLTGTAFAAAELVRIAPSAMNLQPWTMEVHPDGQFTLMVGSRTLLDGGIALCHAELALAGTHHWSYQLTSGGLTAAVKI